MAIGRATWGLVLLVAIARIATAQDAAGGSQSSRLAQADPAPAEDSRPEDSAPEDNEPGQSTPPQSAAGDDGGGGWGQSLVDLLTRIAVHGFVSQGFILTTDNNYLARSEEGSFEFTEVGFNVTTQPLEKLRIGMQLFARDLGPLGNYISRFDWFYADYRASDALGLRFGRVKVPFGLYNEINDIDVARAPILLPQSVYPSSSRDLLLAQTGLELYGLLRLGGGGFLDYRLYGGTIFVPVQQTPGSPFQVADITVPYLVGGRLLWETPLLGLRLGGSVQVLRLESDLLATEYAITTDPATSEQQVTATGVPFTVDIPAVLWVASIEYSQGDLLLAAEYSRWHLEVESSDAARFPDAELTSERAYAAVTYRVSDVFQPSIYYSVLFPDVDDREGRESVQHDTALSLRFDINANWLFKAEAHYMSGTAGLSSALNGGVPPAELTPDWGLFLLKTTAYF